jgi:V/A-type H+/Na+-transporting ATPase subunit A
MNRRFGVITGINGGLITAEFEGDVRQSEVAYAVLGETKLKAEVVRLRGNQADLQVFEDTADLRAGDVVEFTGELLSVELGPGLLGQLYDGLQNPLHRLAEQLGFFLQRGAELPGLDEEVTWAFTPRAKAGDNLEAGDTMGTVPEGIFQHKIMVPFHWTGNWRVEEMVPAGSYGVRDRIGRVRSEEGEVRDLTMSFRWPVKRPIRLYQERLAPTEPLITQIRIIDSLFPVARGGAYCIPGPFGAGKTVLQQITSRFARVDVVVVAACGERAGEVVETIRDFPELNDPFTGRPLMERTIIICNTSSMPVAARESSVYTAVTLAEYYRQMGRHVLLLADSTSRWAQAMRERSGRLEEIPGEEAFPAYLESLIASFYERSGRVRLRDGEIGSVTIGGTVSPAGGNFEEPVTQATLKVVGTFHGLSRERSDARRYPAIDPLESWSRYEGIIPGPRRQRLRQIQTRAHEIGQMMKVVGEEGTSLEDYILFLKAEFFDAVYLQQDAFDPVDEATPAERQKLVFGWMEEILGAALGLPTKKAAREFFQELRQRFIDWNRLEWDSTAFREKETVIRALLQTALEGSGEKAGVGSGRQAWLEPDLDSDFRRTDRVRPRTRDNLLLTTDEDEENSH